MPELPRITAEEVLKAYKKTGIHPITEMFCSDDFDRLCGCPIAALYAASVRANNRAFGWIDAHSESWANKRYGADYVTGFISGFDRPRLACQYVDERTMSAHADGVAVNQAVFSVDWEAAHA